MIVNSISSATESWPKPKINLPVKGSIEKISFWGTYYELEVFVGGKRMIVKTMDGNFIQGDIVDLSVIPDKIWHL